MLFLVLDLRVGSTSDPWSFTRPRNLLHKHVVRLTDGTLAIHMGARFWAVYFILIYDPTAESGIKFTLLRKTLIARKSKSNIGKTKYTPLRF